MSLFHCLGHTKGSVPVRGTCMFRNKASFYGEDLLAPCPTPKLENHPLMTVCDCLFKMFVANLHIGSHSSISSLMMCHAMVTGTHLSQMILLHSVSKHSLKWACLRHMLTYHLEVLTLDKSAHIELSCNYINTGITGQYKKSDIKKYTSILKSSVTVFQFSPLCFIFHFPFIVTNSELKSK
jgi:hypothetical protein